MKKFIQSCSIFFGVLIFTAIFFQLYVLRNSSTFNLINYVSYFTVLSNFFVASVLIFSAIRTDHDKELTFSRGASTLYILITCFGFVFLLGGKNEQLVPWVNLVLHYISPFVMLVSWILTPIQSKIDFTKALVWIYPPITYLAFCMVRGYLINWYPYEFLNFNLTSVDNFIKIISGMILGMIFTILLLVKIPRVIK